MATKPVSAIDKQSVVVKLTKALGRAFETPQNVSSLPFLELLLYAICAENVDHDSAQRAFERLRRSFLDWNEVRVTTLAELENVLGQLPDGAAKSLRIKHLLMHVYDHQYSYIMDSVRKRTIESIHRQLSRIKYLTPFVRNYAIQIGLAAHVLPFDRCMLDVVVWLGLIPVGVREDDASELLKPLVKKPDGVNFCFLIKSFSVSKHFVRVWKANAGSGEAIGELESAPNRLQAALSGDSASATGALHRRKGERLTIARKPRAKSPTKDSASVSRKNNRQSPEK